MNTPRDRAYNMFFNSNLTQQQIAEQVGVSPRTVYDWMKNGNWKTLKATSRLMPAQIVDDIYNHISHLNYKIKSRDFEERYPSKEEAETLRKLIFAIPKVKLNVSRGESAQSMMNFVSWLQHRNNDAAIFVSQFIDEYLHSPREKGLEPYEFEYDADQYYNPTDFPNRTQQTFEESTQSAPPSPSDRRAYFQGGVTAEPSAAPAGGGGSPLAQDTSHNTSSPSERPGEAPLAPEKPPHVTPSPLVEKGPGDEANSQKNGTKPEAISTSTNPTKPTENQKNNPNISTQTPSETKKEKIGSSPQPPEVDIDVQAIFDSWKKIIEKGKRKRRY